MVFEKTLTDVVKGIRANKEKEDEFIRTCISEIKDEIKGQDMSLKVNALQKITYLNMMGWDMSWASFHVIEAMSSPIFSYKRVGYLAASQCFHEDTDILIMTTQLFKKDLLSSNQYEAGIAISCLSTICTPDLGRDLVSDVMTLLNATRPYIRKKAVLVLFKIFLAYPDSLRAAFPRLQEKLVDNHPSVISNTVNIICELAKRNPKNYLSLAPQFFKILASNNNNNWTLIKIIKLLGELCPHEPRLGKKLVEPFTNIINSTSAKSVLYECLFTVTKGMQDQKGIYRLAVEKLKTFVEDKDQNIKYLGLLGLNNIMSVFPKLVSDMKDNIILCLEDVDVTIRYRALDIICGVVTKKNIKNIISKLLKACVSADGPYRNILIEKIIESCSKNNYENIPSFKWFMDVLIELTELKGLEKGELISFHIKNIFIRVKTVRSWGVEDMLKLINSEAIQKENLETSTLSSVLNSAAWVIGEFINESDVKPSQVLEDILKPQINTFPTWIQACWLQTIIKIYAASCTKDTSLQTMRDKIRKEIQEFLTSSDVEVQERAITCFKLLQLHEEFLETGIDIGPQIKSLFDEELNPVAPGSQSKVPLPEGLNLDEWINDKTEFEEEVEKEVTVMSESTMRNQSKFILPKSHKTKDISELGEIKKVVVKPKKKVIKKKIPSIIEKVEISNVYEKPHGFVEEVEVKKVKKDKLGEIDLLSNEKIVALPIIKEYQQVKEVKVKEEKVEKVKEVKLKEEKIEKVEKIKVKKKKIDKVIEKVSLLSFDEPKKETRRKKLCSDDFLKVSYNPKVIPHDTTHIDIPIHIENLSNSNLQNLDYSVSSTINCKLEKPIPPTNSLMIGHSSDIILNLVFKSFERSQTLNGLITYVKDEKKSLKFMIKLPCSMFFIPRTITQETFSQLLKEIPFSASRRCKFTEKMKDMVICSKEISSHVNVEIIGKSSNGIFMYSKSIQNHHLAIILIPKGESEMSVEVKCSIDSIANDILSEVLHLLKK